MANSLLSDTRSDRRNAGLGDRARIHWSLESSPICVLDLPPHQSYPPRAGAIADRWRFGSTLHDGTTLAVTYNYSLQ